MRRSIPLRAAKPSFLLPLLVGIALAGSACSHAPPSAQLQGPPLPLWEVRGGGEVLYLLGSVHLLRPEVYPLDEAIYDAFDEAQVVAFELDLGDALTAAPLMVQRGTYLDGRTLRDVLLPELYDDALARAQEVGMPLHAAERMKPWFLSLTLSSLLFQRSGFQAGAGIDMHFQERAREAGKTIVGLETVREQIEFFEGLDEPSQVALLRSTLDQWDHAVADLDRATVLWQRGDVEGLAILLRESMEDQTALAERLLHERNRNWISAIERLIGLPETAMVIVGMGHLAGEGSVVELLRERGYAVTQLRAGRAAGATPRPGR
jgi:uncharacterized protein